jgi:hypothetical protein
MTYFEKAIEVSWLFVNSRITGVANRYAVFLVPPIAKEIHSLYHTLKTTEQYTFYPVAKALKHSRLYALVTKVAAS